MFASRISPIRRVGTLSVVVLAMGAATGVAQAAPTNPTPVCDRGTCTVTFPAAGSAYTWGPPPGVSSLSVTAMGGQGSNAGGAGAKVTATLAVKSTDTLTISPGGSGSQDTGGWNGGGNGGSWSSATSLGGGGGGASDVRLNGTALGDRIITAGGGGGSESHCGIFFSAGGNAGSNGEAGQGYSTTVITQFWHNYGDGGTLDFGGGGGFFNFNPTYGGNGVSGVGGAANAMGGGGGGGYYGGGGATNSNPSCATSGLNKGIVGGAGGGGSSYVTSPATGAAYVTGANYGPGVVTLQYTDPGPGPMPVFPNSVTFVARVCPTFGDINQNRKRDDLHDEALSPVGPSTPYAAGQVIMPSTEAAGNQGKCTPLSGWQFKLGTGTKTRGDAGDWGSMSKVTGQFDNVITTQDSVPLLNDMGGETGQTIAGATTVSLNVVQALLARKPGSLWVQSGVPGDPLLQAMYGNTYSFGALRCSTDGQYGDNVDFFAFPAGSTHQFCYVYLVKEPSQAGTIVIKKALKGPLLKTLVGTGYFTGNTSNNDAGGNFFVIGSAFAAGIQRFTRQASDAGATPVVWNVNESSQSGWQLDSVDCTSANGTSSFSKSVINRGFSAGKLGITLGASDTATCTFTNEVEVPKELELSAVSNYATGSFGYSVKRVGDGSDPVTRTIRTTTKGIPAEANAVDVTAPGTYAVTESLPLTSVGRWSLDKVVCDGQSLAISDNTVQVPVMSTGLGAACEFTNTFTPVASITLKKETLGAAGSVGYVVTSKNDKAFMRTQTATTTTAGAGGIVTAKGDSLRGLPLGTYMVQETNTAYPSAGEWMVQSLVCNGTPVPTAQGLAQISLTADAPDATCVWTNLFTPNPPTPLPFTPVSPASVPSGPGSNTTGLTPINTNGATPVMRPASDLVLSVGASPRVGAAGRRVTLTAKVRNEGPDAARNVTVVFKSPLALRPASIMPSAGKCRPKGAMMFMCSVGTVLRNHSVRFTATRTVTAMGKFTFMGAASTSTSETSMRNNMASTTVVVSGGAPVTG